MQSLRILSVLKVDLFFVIYLNKNAKKNLKTIVQFFLFGPKMKIDQDWEFKSQELHNSSIESCETQEHFLFYSHKHSK